MKKFQLAALPLFVIMISSFVLISEPAYVKVKTVKVCKKQLPKNIAVTQAKSCKKSYFISWMD